MRHSHHLHTKALCAIVLLLLLTTAKLHTNSSARPSVIELTDYGFDSAIKQHDGDWIIEFYAPWCSFCQRFEPQYEQFATATAETHPNVRIARLNVDTNTVTSTRFLISRLPTVFHIHRHDQVRQLLPPFTKEKLTDVLASRDWKRIVPWSNWWSPFSLFGSALWGLGWIVKGLQLVSQTLQQHLPMWAVIGVGIVGMVLVSILFSMALPDTQQLRQAKQEAAIRSQTNAIISEDVVDEATVNKMLRHRTKQQPS